MTREVERYHNFPNRTEIDEVINSAWVESRIRPQKSTGGGVKFWLGSEIMLGNKVPERWTVGKMETC